MRAWLAIALVSMLTAGSAHAGNDSAPAVNAELLKEMRSSQEQRQEAAAVAPDAGEPATVESHLAKGDVARWFREYIKDPDLADEADRIARASGSSPADSRVRIKTAIERRYTAPA